MGKINDIYNEIIGKKIIDLGFKNSQYEQKFFKLYWKIFLNLFIKFFSHKFDFNFGSKYSNNRTIYLEAKIKNSYNKVLFVLSLPEGQMPTFNNGVLARLKFKDKLVKKYVMNFDHIFFITFYAPLKIKLSKNDDNESIIKKH